MFTERKEIETSSWKIRTYDFYSRVEKHPKTNELTNDRIERVPEFSDTYQHELKSYKAFTCCNVLIA